MSTATVSIQELIESGQTPRNIFKPLKGRVGTPAELVFIRH